MRDQEFDSFAEAVEREAAEQEARHRRKDANSKGDKKPNGKAEQTAPFTLAFFDDLSECPSAKPWVIKNVIARDETSSWFAPPGKGKSAMLTDLGVHAAAGLDWRGYRTKGRSGVVYFALERADLVRRRLIAHKLRDGLHGLPIAVAGEVIDLFDRKCVGAIFDTIKKAEDRFGCEPGSRFSTPIPKVLRPAVAMKTRRRIRTSSRPICADCSIAVAISTSQESAIPGRMRAGASAVQMHASQM
jgi:AAA domain